MEHSLSYASMKKSIYTVAHVLACLLHLGVQYQMLNLEEICLERNWWMKWEVQVGIIEMEGDSVTKLDMNVFYF